MATYYANSRFKTDINEWGNVGKWIEPGDKITQSDIGVDDDEWQSLIDAGAVVEEYPDDLDPQIPPAEYYRANAAAESAVEEVEAAAKAEAEAESPKKEAAPAAPTQAPATPSSNK